MEKNTLFLAGLRFAHSVISAVILSLFTADFGTDAGPNLQLDSWQSETQMSHDQFLFMYLCVFVCVCVRACL